MVCQARRGAPPGLLGDVAELKQTRRYWALVALGVDRQGMLYVDADLACRPTPEMVAEAVEWYCRFRPDAFGVEAHQF